MAEWGGEMGHSTANPSVVNPLFLSACKCENIVFYQDFCLTAPLVHIEKGETCPTLTLNALQSGKRPPISPMRNLLLNRAYAYVSDPGR